MFGVWLVLAALCAAAVGEVDLQPFAAPAHYTLESTVLINDISRRDKDVGYKIRAALHLLPVYADPPNEYLLQFRLVSPKMLQRTKDVNADFSEISSPWDSLGDTEFYAHWRNGVVETAYLPPDDPLDVLNFKKALISLFQFQNSDGDRNETDISGDCEVLYETVAPDTFRKIKRRCADDEAWDGAVTWRRLTRYEARARRLRSVLADELLLLAEAGAGLKARCWLALTAAGGAGTHAGAGPQAGAASLGAALAALPAGLAPAPLPAQPPAPPAPPAQGSELEAAVEEHLAALGGEAPGRGGGAAHAAALLALLPALQAAPAPALLRLLQRPTAHHLRPGLCRALGLAGTAAALQAAHDFLQLAAPDPLQPLAAHFLQAFALALHPQEEAALGVLRLARTARAPAVAHAALLAGAAAARRCPAAVGAAARDELLRGLARCKDEECRAVRLHALGNLRRADTVEALLEHAADGSLAALDALEAAPASALTRARLGRLGALALRPSLPLELRAAALDLCARRRAADPLPLLPLLRELRAGGERDAELLRLLRQRLEALEPEHEGLRLALRRLPRAERGWDARASPGTSSVLARATGWALPGWRAQLDSVQLARRALLRRGRVRLEARGEAGEGGELLQVELWTRGLDALAGGGGGEEGGEEAMAAGLALAVGGVRSQGVTLFEGQGELMGHVWAGSGSAPTRLARALLPLRARSGCLRLASGAVLAASWHAALALALDARAVLALWGRTARAQLALRAGLAAHASLALPALPALPGLAAHAAAQADSRMRIYADLDFYDAVALCVRVHLDDHEIRSNVSLSGAGVRRRRDSRRRGAGRTLALGAPNDAVCRQLRAADEPDEPDETDEADETDEP